MGLPIQGSDVAVAWDSLFLFLVWLSVFFFILVVGGMIYFAIRYRSSKVKNTKYITDHHGLEAFWTIVPTILLMGIFVWGWSVYKQMTQTPPDAMEVHVIAKQWSWAFQYDDGRVFSNELYVPLDKPVKLVMTSEDVIHSFFIPSFRVKSDVVPGMYTNVWFQAKVPGAHQVFCTEYCGTMHSGMLAKIYVLDEKNWRAFKAGKEIERPGKAGGEIQTLSLVKQDTSISTPHLSLSEQGKKLVEMKGCVACHSTDGTRKIGPSYKGIYGKDEELSDGSKVKVDDDYIRESILKPAAKIVKGYSPVMPPFQGLVNEQEMNAIIAYIKSLK